MAAITWQGFTTFVNNQISAVQSSLGRPIYSAIGSVTLALAQSIGGVALWLQAQAINILALTRAATSNGSDLDSWMADYGLTRIAAISATGQATFSRYSTMQQALIPVGAQISTGPGGIIFQVTKDPTNGAWSSSLNGYVIPVSTASVTVPIAAVTAGVIGNVLANTIQSFVTPIAFVDTVTNATATGVSPYVVGQDAETDPAFRARFVTYLDGLSKATLSAVESAIASVQQGLTYQVVENVAYGGGTRLGYFFAVVDDGSGTPPGSLLTAVSTAIDAVRGLTSVFGVYAPVVETANVAMSITSAPGFDHATVCEAVEAALTTFINKLGVGVNLPYSQLFSVAYGVSGVNNAYDVTLNSGTSDFDITDEQVIKAGTITAN